MAGFLQRGLLLYLFLAIAVSFAAPDVIFANGSPAGNNVLSWFDLSYNDVTGDVTASPQFATDTQVQNATSGLETPSAISQSGGILGWLDPLFQVFSWIPLIFKVLFSPILLLTNPLIAMPTSVILIIGIPLVLLIV